ncbi:MAG: hypothetical protein FJW39_30185 [Acidobacteria bacterium]|nr:hypothetical protein [Acidobacteriota bacterium]
MNNDVHVEEDASSNPDGPLEAALESAALSPDARRAARDATDVGFGILMISQEVEKAGFAGMPFRRYIDAVASRAKVDLRPIMSWLKIEKLEPLDPDFGAAAAELAKTFGMSARQLWVQTGYDLLMSLRAQSPAPVLYRMVGSRSAEVESCERDLQGAIDALSPGDREVMSRLRRQIEEGYGQPG